MRILSISAPPSRKIFSRLFTPQLTSPCRPRLVTTQTLPDFTIFPTLTDRQADAEDEPKTTESVLRPPIL